MAKHEVTVCDMCNKDMSRIDPEVDPVGQMSYRLELCQGNQMTRDTMGQCSYDICDLCADKLMDVLCEMQEVGGVAEWLALAYISAWNRSRDRSINEAIKNRATNKS